MELYEVMRTTFAAREFTDEVLPDDVLYDILENARFAPSGGNRQGNRVIVVRDAETRGQLAKLAEPAAKRYAAQIKAGESPWNAVIATKVTAEEIANTPAPAPLTESFKAASVVLVFVVDLKMVASMDQDLDRIGVISGASIYPFVWNTLLAARQAGFGGTITTLAAAMEPDVQALLNIPADHAVSAVVPLGKPVKQLTKLRRNSVEQIASRENFDGAAFTLG
ncbi:MAG: nitroreductase family protein [Alphaproteobacteria bacterium]|jgi:nitroreductase|nr:nitroreductase family protein [Alphaproteobacteria bacterium]MDP6816349.1 nitroreductase family protein [Alphaproteobacteria bacterium]